MVFLIPFPAVHSFRLLLVHGLPGGWHTRKKLWQSLGRGAPERQNLTTTFYALSATIAMALNFPNTPISWFTRITQA